MVHGKKKCHKFGVRAWVFAFGLFQIVGKIGGHGRSAGQMVAIVEAQRFIFGILCADRCVCVCVCVCARARSFALSLSLSPSLSLSLSLIHALCIARSLMFLLSQKESPEVHVTELRERERERGRQRSSSKPTQNLDYNFISQSVPVAQSQAILLHL